MGRAEAGTPKAIGNAMKSRGLQKLRWYCQVCEKQCRDENGFKCHTMSEGHLRQMLVVGENAGKHIQDYSATFQTEFVAMLSRRWGTKRVRINQVYQEYIADKSHLHMNATRWLSLTEFTKHLGRTGIAHVDETEKGWFLAWIDNSPKALAKQEANQKKERGDMDDETRQRKLIEEQIERARREGEKRRIEANGGIYDGESNGLNNGEGINEESKELKREEGEKVSLNLSFKTKVLSSTSTSEELPIASSSKLPSPPLPTGSTSFTSDSSSLSSTSNPIVISTPTPSNFILPPTKAPIGFTPKPNAFKMSSNPLKKVNPLKSNPLKSSSSSGSMSINLKRPAPVSNVEAIIQQEMERKARMANGSSSSSGGNDNKRPRY